MFKEKARRLNLFRHKEESRLVILREKREALATSACLIRHSQKGQNIPDPPPQISKKSEIGQSFFIPLLEKSEISLFPFSFGG